MQKIFFVNGLSDFPTVLDWMSGVDTWEEVDVSDSKFTSFCGDSCIEVVGHVHLKRQIVSNPWLC